MINSYFEAKKYVKLNMYVSKLSTRDTSTKNVHMNYFSVSMYIQDIQLSKKYGCTINKKAKKRIQGGGTK